MLNNERIRKILSILRKNKQSYTKLYETLVNETGETTSYRDFSYELNKLVAKGWIHKKDNGKRGSRVFYSISDFGTHCYVKKINFEEYDDYEKSIYPLLLSVGFGIRYDSKKLSRDEIKTIHVRGDYNSISKTEMHKSILKNPTLFGNIKLEENSSERIDDLFGLLLRMNIFKFNNKNGRYYFVNENFREFFISSWGILYQYLFRIMFEYVYSFIRKPTKEERIWLETILSKHVANDFIIYYYNRYTNRREWIKKKKYKLDGSVPLSGGTLHNKMRALIKDLSTYIQWLKNKYLGEGTHTMYQVFISRIILIIFPKFIQDDNFIPELKINPTKMY